MELMINGLVLCHCGGQIISNSGKILGVYPDNYLTCWQCKRKYGFDYTYNKRKENDTVQLSQSEQIKSIIFNIISMWSNEYYGDGIWHGYDVLRYDLIRNLCAEISMYRIKKLTKELKSEGLITYEPTFDGDGIIRGSGYFVRQGWKEDCC